MIWYVKQERQKLVWDIALDMMNISYQESSPGIDKCLKS